MTTGRKLHLALVLMILSGTLFTISQEQISSDEISEVVGEKPTASLYAIDSVSTDSLADSLSYDFLTELFSVVESEFENQHDDVAEDEAFSVLDYVTQAYKNSGFYDVGTWEQYSGKRKPQIYDGKLTIDESKFCRPVKGKVTSSFGYRNDAGNVHLGVDMAGRRGDTVRVALPGKVMRCRFDKKGYGWYVCVVDSSGVETRYAHLSKVLVKRGDIMKGGEAVGLVGTTGNSTGPHLHFEMRYRGKVVNPMFYLSN